MVCCELRFLVAAAVLFGTPYVGAAEIDLEAFSRPTEMQAGPLSPDGRYAVFYDQTRGVRRARSTSSRTKRWLGNPPGKQALRVLDLNGGRSLMVEDSARVALTSWWISQRYLLVKRRDQRSGRLLGLALVDIAEGLLRKGLLDSVPTAPMQVSDRILAKMGPEIRVRYIPVPLPDDSADVTLLAPMWKTESAAMLGVRRANQRDIKVFRFNAGERALTVVETGLQHVVSWLFDDAGQARAAIQRGPQESENLMVRRPLSIWKNAASGPRGLLRLLSFDSVQNRIWLSSSLHRERFAIFWLDPQEGKIEGPFFESPEFDVTDIAADPADGHLLYVQYEADRLRCVYFDAPGSLFHARIDAALPKTSNDVLSSSLDGKRSMIAARSSNAPTRYYLLDMRSNALLELYQRRSWLKPAQLGATKTIQFKNRAGVERWGQLTRAVNAGKGTAPLVLLLHDGPGGRRIEHRFDPMSQMLASSGFTVLSVDHAGTRGHGRGLAGYDDADLLADIEVDVQDAMGWAEQQHLAAAGQICVVGRGIGGQAAEAVLLRSPAVRCAVGIHSTAAPLAPLAPIGSETLGPPREHRAMLVIQDGGAGVSLATPKQGTSRSGVDRLALDLRGVAAERRRGVVYHAVVDFLGKHLSRQQQDG